MFLIYIHIPPPIPPSPLIIITIIVSQHFPHHIRMWWQREDQCVIFKSRTTQRPIGIIVVSNVRDIQCLCLQVCVFSFDLFFAVEINYRKLIVVLISLQPLTNITCQLNPPGQLHRSNECVQECIRVQNKFNLSHPVLGGFLATLNTRFIGIKQWISTIGQNLNQSIN